MTDKLEIPKEAVGAIYNSAERFIGYFYAGLLPLVILYIENYEIIEKFVKATGGFLALIICFALGIGIYSLYFRILGEFFIFPLQHFLHFIIDKFITPPERTSSTIRFIYNLGVPFTRCRFAYQIIKDNLFSKDERKEIQISHGELCVVFLTSVITFFAYIIIYLTKGYASNIYLFVSAISFLAALLGDTHQHSIEAFRFHCLKKDVIKILVEYGFIDVNLSST